MLWFLITLEEHMELYKSWWPLSKAGFIHQSRQGVQFTLKLNDCVHHKIGLRWL